MRKFFISVILASILSLQGCSSDKLIKVVITDENNNVISQYMGDIVCQNENGYIRLTYYKEKLVGREIEKEEIIKLKDNHKVDIISIE